MDQNPVKILGIWVYYDPQKREKLNFHEALNKTRETLQVWAKRKLTVMGKISIVNTLVASVWNHKFLVLPTPDSSFFRDYRRIITDFIWDDKPHKISYQKIVQSYTSGGLQLVDLQARDTAIKSKWPIYFADRELGWFYGVLNLDHHIWQFNTEPKDVNRLCQKVSLYNPFKSIWVAWAKNFFSIPEREQINEQYIFANSCIRLADQPFWDKAFLNSNLDCVAQLKHHSES